VVELDDAEKPLPIRKLLIPKVLIASFNYALLALVDIAFRALQPLFLSTPVDDGGLGLSPPIIGSVLSYFGIINGVFQVFFFAKLIDKFGVRNVFVLGIVAAVPCFILFPISNLLARRAGGELTFWVWSAIVMQVSLSVLISLCYGTFQSQYSVYG
jgi:MFS family permease